VAASVFVSLRARHRKAAAPELRIVDPAPRLDAREHVGADADAGHADGPAMKPARQQRMADLAAKERHRFRGP
jgi:hypothetical protein